jgi:hypothetical protein
MRGDDAMRTETPGPEQALAAHYSHEDATSEVPAWEEIDTGRFMPRRIKGSCKGRALG